MVAPAGEGARSGSRLCVWRFPGSASPRTLDAMRMSRLFGRTLRQAPADAETASHRLLLRAGCIDQLMAGAYSYMPLGRRARLKAENVVREEMDAAGGQEVLLPAIQPVELWQQSGREEAFGPVLFHLNDQRGRGLVLGPTHEEVITRLFADHSSSYRDLPVTLYQIQTKFRDEGRPRGGLVRVREFTMKDAYSFDVDEDGLTDSYDAMFQAYRRIFARCGVPTVPVEADSGAIGGKGSQEFIFLSEAGEDTVALCSDCGYAANTEKAAFVRPPAAPEDPLPVEEVSTPGTTTIEQLATLLEVPTSRTAKAVFYMAGGGSDPEEPIFAVVRGDLEINEVKLSNELDGRAVRAMTDAEVEHFGLVAGSASPVGLGDRMTVVAGRSVAASPTRLAGADKADFHLRNVNLGRDWQASLVADIALAEDGHRCAACGTGVIRLHRGIEMGHVFRLGQIYSEAFSADVLGADGQPVVPTMGCYGIGVDRIVAAAVEANHDEDGISWPVSVAPYDVQLVALRLDRDPPVAEEAEALYAELENAGLEVLFDDRDESPGVKFNDADLIGLPWRLTVSARNQAQGAVELRTRATGEVEHVPRGEVASRLQALRAAAIEALDPDA